jgi:hypothetical protein
MLFLPRRLRLICFFIVTPWEIGVILTANYAFLNYLVLVLGFLLLDDRSIQWLIPARFRRPFESVSEPLEQSASPVSIIHGASERAPEPTTEPRQKIVRGMHNHFSALCLAVVAVLLTWIAYDTTAEMIRMPFPDAPVPTQPIALLEPFRIANQYGLFAIMTRGRYEIEFQGSNDGQTWTPYPFRFKPQALNEAPAIYAPYQPRFDWNLWFASLTDWQQANIVPLTEEHLLEGDPDVLSLFRGNPFPNAPPRYIRAVLWQYWFTSMDQKRRTGNWWRRDFRGLYAPELSRAANGKFNAIQWPEPLPPHE